MPEIPTTPILFPPNGLDRASGLDGLPGTPTPDGTVMIVTPNGNDVPLNAVFFEEYPDSPTVERAEQATITHRFACDETTGQSLISAYNRGSILLDSNNNLTRVLSNTLQYTKGEYCILTMVSEGLSFDTPPDLFSIEIVELNPPAEKHPRYNELTYQDRYLVRNANISDASDLATQYSSIIDTLPGAPPGGIGPVDETQRTEYNEAKELLLKLHKGEENFYLPGYKISWSQYFWSPTLINPGGYTEDPIYDGGLPYFFWSLDGTTDPDDNNNTWFGELQDINPVIYDNGLSWLRLADSVDYERTWYKVTHSWQGGPLGFWDHEWYDINGGLGQGKVVQPYQTSDNASAFGFSGV